ncbi:Peptidoglycan/xylan/chitin deacetylase, PgdA/CDA1 family [Pseudarcicella hirudinis]|uniref:Peptidoglycan/xylan/chitin deacetylase, PgdA/CDA1 family n=2 Tax=Pseudarcicella hirudinis TaxID=1079859 RepID=A0A1I5SK55_9BACT|nr:Peptidoglycan/xylan/chitin deacetylase, PgdA/CDA1 family [Pseudarcicella hirudinis]
MKSLFYVSYVPMWLQIFYVSYVPMWLQIPPQKTSMNKILILSILSLFARITLAQQSSWVRINQLGYLPNSVKVAVWVSKEHDEIKEFGLYDAFSKKRVFHSVKIKSFGKYAAFESSARLDFSEFRKSGMYFIKSGNAISPNFRINADVYDGTADFILRYMRQQRSGYNPFLKDSCHKQDGFIVYHPDPKKDSTHLDVSGGWHDASDYLQYVTTSANAAFQLLFAYQQNPEVYGDEHDAWGNKGKNNIPDILDEAKWGIDWLLKMNPGKNEMYNQLADDRDHKGMRLPNHDKVQYAGNQGLARPVYFVTGKPQGFKYKNRTTGVASTAGKYASTFALASQVLRKFYPGYADQLIPKAIDAYEFGKQFPGVCQTAPGGAPYFYEEDNWVDDMELAATQLYAIKAPGNYYQEAASLGRQEPQTPWMGADTARHYQWYPFLNLGHFYMSNNTGDSEKYSATFKEFMRQGIEKVYLRGKNNPFQNGIPFVWCSNNYVSAMITQIMLYQKVSGTKAYDDMLAALRDWLFGCNPWGAGMIGGLPEDGVSPHDPHSSLAHLNHYKLDGGLVDGPVYGSIWKGLIGITLYQPDEFAAFQSNLVVYHDDYGDYSTNEPTMDGTASLSYLLASLENEGTKENVLKNLTKEEGAIVRMNKKEKKIYLTFTGHTFNDGGELIAKVLKKHQVKANFFFTGDFYRNPAFKGTILQLIKDQHYLGGHSDKHLLYVPWENRDSLLVSKEDFLKDLSDNYTELAKFGIKREKSYAFMPPYEWYNSTISDWCKEQNITLVNYTGGTSSNADYTTPEMKNYVSSDRIYQKIMDYEVKNAGGLNGFILLSHVGTDPARTDKFYYKLDKLISTLKKKGYTFGTF